MDAAGKDGTIKHVMSGVNPQGCQVFSFKQPSAEELDHDFLWRYAIRLPERMTDKTEADAKPMPISMGIVNFTEETIIGGFAPSPQHGAGLLP